MDREKYNWDNFRLERKIKWFVQWGLVTSIALPFSRRKNEFSRKRAQSSNHSTLAFRPFTNSAWPLASELRFILFLRITKIILRNKIFNYCRLQMYRSMLLPRPPLSLSISLSLSLAGIKSNNLFRLRRAPLSSLSLRPSSEKVSFARML